MKRELFRLRGGSLTLSLLVGLVLFASPVHAQLSVGDPVDFTLRTIDDQVFQASDLHGKLVVVEHWATWCGPCVAIVPKLKEMHAEYAPQGVVLIGISHDRSDAPVRPFMEKHGITWPQVMNNDAQRAPNWGCAASRTRLSFRRRASCCGAATPRPCKRRWPRRSRTTRPCSSPCWMPRSETQRSPASAAPAR